MNRSLPLNYSQIHHYEAWIIEMICFFIADAGFSRSFYTLYPNRITPLGKRIQHYHGHAVLKALIHTLQHIGIFNDCHIYISPIVNDNPSIPLQQFLPYIHPENTNILSCSFSTKSSISNSLTTSYHHIFSAYDASHPSLNRLSNAFSCSNRNYNADFILPINYKLFGISGNSLITPIIAALYAANPSLKRVIDIPPYLHPNYVNRPIIQPMPKYYPKCPKCYTNVKSDMTQCPHCGHYLK